MRRSWRGIFRNILGAIGLAWLGKPRLFAAEPHPHALLRLTLEAYP